MFGDAGLYRAAGSWAAHGYPRCLPGNRDQAPHHQSSSCSQALRELAEPVERALSQVRAVVEHPFHIPKNRFRHKKLRYRGLNKNHSSIRCSPWPIW